VRACSTCPPPPARPPRGVLPLCSGMGQSCGISGLETTSEEINLQVENLQVKIAKADTQIRQLVAAAAADPSAKQRALQIMRRKKVWEEQRQQLIGAQFNVDALADQEEQAKYTLRAVQAMKVGRDRLKKSQDRMNPQMVDALLDDTAELAGDMKAINDSLAHSSGLTDLESDYAELQRELRAAATLNMGQQDPAPGYNAMARQEPAPAYNAPARQPCDAGRCNDRARHGVDHQVALPPPPPPPPPPHRPTTGHSYDDMRNHSQAPRDNDYANVWAASALKAAMAPYGHLPGAAPGGALPLQSATSHRIAMAA